MHLLSRKMVTAMMARRRFQDRAECGEIFGGELIIGMQSEHDIPRHFTEKEISVRHLFISSGHNFFGHHGQEPGTSPNVEVPQIECLAGRGISGDRFLDYKDDYKGQITFFALEVFEDVCLQLGLKGLSPSAVRRNAITQGVDLNRAC